jgi:hypothetical protein
MSTAVIFGKNNISVRYWAKKEKKWKTRQLLMTEVYGHLWEQADLRGATTGSILAILHANPTLWTTILQEPFLPSLLQEFGHKVKAKASKNKFDKLVVRFRGESGKYDNYKTNLLRGKKGEMIFKSIPPKKLKIRREFNHYYDVHGISRGKEYAVDFSPLKDYVDAVVVFADKFELYRMDYTHGRDKTVPPEKPEILGECGITVLDLFKAIVYELTFHGAPANRDARREDLMKKVDDIKSGEGKYYPVKFE